MQRSKQIVACLPMLRRFARLLMGDQRSGDALVLSTLQCFSTEMHNVPGNEEPKPTLYRILMQTWESPSGQFLAEKSTRRESVSESRQRRRSEISRAAFLLTHVEAFSSDQIQFIMGLDSEAYDDCVARANVEVNYLLATNVLIIEDELLIAGQLESIMRSLGHQVTSVARTAKQAIAAANSNPPNLILSDIQLADGSSGIDAVQEIVSSHLCPAIFVTAYPERLLTGARPEPTFLLAKPFKVDQIKAVVSQAVFTDAKIRWQATSEDLAGALSNEWGASVNRSIAR